MKISETWNQGFEDMRFDSLQGHIVRQEYLQQGNKNIVLFGPEEIAVERNRVPLQQGIANYHNSQSESGRQERYEYSQTEGGPSLSDIKKGQESQVEDKSIRILQQSNNRIPNELPGNYIQPNINQRQATVQIRIQQKDNSQLPRMPPHYPQPQYSRPPPQHPSNVRFQEQRRPSGFRSIDSAPTQQSYAPSQKTLVMPHTQYLPPSNQVYKSHITTERFQPHAVQHSDLKITNSKPKVNTDMNSMLRPEGGVKSIMNDSNIPQGYSQSTDHMQISEGEWWRDKYQEQKQQFQAIRAQDIAEIQSASNHIILIEQENKKLRASLQKLSYQYEKRVEQIRILQTKLQQNPKSSQDSELRRQVEEWGMLITLIKKQNENLKAKEVLCSQYQIQIQALQEAMQILKMQLQQKDSHLLELRKYQSPLKLNDMSQLNQSRAVSVQNTKILELQMQNGRLMAQMTARDQNHEQQLKLSTLKFNQLAEKYNSTILEKDQTIRMLQQKYSLLESDLNKKDSLLRNLRDELVQIQRKKGHSPQQSYVSNPPTSSSAIHSPGERQEKAQKQESKRQIDNLKKHLFDKERQVTVIEQRLQQTRQLLQETESTSTRRKNDIQNLRRKLAQNEDIIAQYTLLKETLNKKNNQLIEMREILLEKEEHSGQYQFLTKQNQKFKQIIVKKNDQLSDLDFRLRQAQKKMRQQERYNPQIQALEEQVQALNSHLRSYQSQIERLNTNLEHSNERILQGQLRLQKQEQRYHDLENEINNYHNQNQQLQRQYQKILQKEQLMQRELQSMASKVVSRQKQLAFHQQSIKQLSSEKNQYEAIISKLQKQLQKINSEEKQLKMQKMQQNKQIQQISKKHLDQLAKIKGDMQLLMIRYRQIQNIAKNQKEKLIRIEPEIEVNREKIIQHQQCETVIKGLNAKIQLYEKKLLSSPYARNLFEYLPQNSHKTFENKLIYELKKQNEDLKVNLKKCKPLLASRRDNDVPGIRSRLSQFAINLDRAIKDEQNLKRSKSQDNFVHPTQRQINSSRRIFHKTQTNSNTMRYPELQQQISISNLQKLYNQKLGYFRLKNHELQQRNSTLVKINTELKQNIIRAKQNRDSEMQQFYASDLKFQKQKSSKLQRKLEKAQLQNMKLQKQLTGFKMKLSKLESTNNACQNFTLKEMTSDFHS